MAGLDFIANLLGGSVVAKGLAEGAEIKGSAVGLDSLDRESAPGAGTPLPSVDGMMLLVAPRRSVFLAVGVDGGAPGGDCRREETFHGNLQTHGLGSREQIGGNPGKTCRGLPEYWWKEFAIILSIRGIQSCAQNQPSKTKQGSRVRFALGSGFAMNESGPEKVFVRSDQEPRCSLWEGDDLLSMPF